MTRDEQHEGRARYQWVGLFLGPLLALMMLFAGAPEGLGIAAWRTAAIGVLPLWVIVIAAATMIIFLTELTSNTATTATFLPVVGAIAVEAGVDPIILTVPVTLAASCAFMLPVATPPNAIVFGSGMLTIPIMARGAGAEPDRHRAGGGRRHDARAQVPALRLTR